MWVIKLGGSVTHYDSLVRWLQLVVRWGDGKVIIVPGGGMYADAVREFQRMRATLPTGHIDDAQAHALAIFAMDQMARSLAAMVPELALVRNPLEIAESGWQHRGLIWLPSEMALNMSEEDPHHLPQHWEVTSDSLAAWLAWQLEANHLVLVKSDVRLLAPMPSLNVKALQVMGMVDQSLSALLVEAPFETYVIHQSQYAVFEHGFAQSKVLATLQASRVAVS